MDVIFVHGALVNDGAWWWHRTAELLEARTGARSITLALPSCGEVGAPPSDDAGAGALTADAAALRRALDAVAAPGGAIVVGHSYGGTVIAEAGAHPAIAHLVYVSSYLPAIGSSQASIMGAEPDPVSVSDGGDQTLALAGYDERSFGERFLQDADEATVHEAWQRVTRQSATAFVTPTTREGWKDAPSTYLVCTDDRSTTVALQRVHAARATRSVDIASGHHPFLTHPDEVVEVLAPLVGRES